MFTRSEVIVLTNKHTQTNRRRCYARTLGKNMSRLGERRVSTVDPRSRAPVTGRHMCIMPSSHRRHGCLVRVDGVNWIGDKTRQFCPVSKCSPNWILFCLDPVSNLQMFSLKYYWGLLETLDLSPVQFTPPTRTRQDKTVLSCPCRRYVWTRHKEYPMSGCRDVTLASWSSWCQCRQAADAVESRTVTQQHGTRQQVLCIVRWIGGSKANAESAGLASRGGLDEVHGRRTTPYLPYHTKFGHVECIATFKTLCSGARATRNSRMSDELQLSTCDQCQCWYK